MINEEASGSISINNPDQHQPLKMVEDPTMPIGAIWQKQAGFYPFPP
jgi:hypothetical protein